MIKLIGWISLFSLLLLFSCKNRPVISSLLPTKHLQINLSDTPEKIAFGSCSKQYEAQPIWSSIVENDPDLWIWLGDNIYGDTEDMQVLRDKYQQQNDNKDYQKLLATCPIIGTWDDHDYGVNDGGKEYPKRKESKQLFTEFMGYDASHPIHKHEGVYHSYNFGEGEKSIKIILLDSRYFRDPIARQNSTYVQNNKGTILGKKQWKWLEQELKNSKAKVHIIGNGIQVIPEEHRFEKWANFPQERQRLLDVIKKWKVANPILLSGDRHAAEISRLAIDDTLDVYEVTASGLTHAYTSGGIEPNRYRLGEDRVRTTNFGLIKVDWKANELSLELRGLGNELFVQKKVKLRK